MIHGDRARAGSFGEDAQAYDRWRPRYPAAMFDDLLAGHPADRPAAVVDVGCGTGIAAAELAARGCDVVGVEPDPRMAAVATAKGLAVEVATFEAWDARGRSFDLLTSGQAWHWVDPERGPVKAASVLRPGGRLAVFWNLGTHDESLQAELDEVYARRAPALSRHSVARGGVRRVGDAEAIAASGLFEEPEVSRYPWVRTYTTAEWIAQLPTHSDHRLLPDPVREALLRDVAAVLDARGGAFDMPYETLLVTACTRRR